MLFNIKSTSLYANIVSTVNENISYISSRLQAAFSDGLVERTRKEMRMGLAVASLKFFAETNGGKSLVAEVVWNNIQTFILNDEAGPKN